MTNFHSGDTLRELLVSADASIREALDRIDANGRGIVFALDADGRLVGLATDGDVRRALLAGAVITDRLERCLNRQCVTASSDMNAQQVLALMDERVHCVPIVDAAGRPVDFALFEQAYRVPVAEPSLGGRELEYVSDCIATNWISSKGKYVDRFEAGFAALCGTRFALSTSNGTTALHLALAALGIGPGDEVIVPDLTFIASANAVTYCGATAVLVDVDPETWTIDADAAAAAVTPRTRGIMAVHLYGHPSNMRALGALAARSGLFVLEDCAEALGARCDGRIVGGLGTAGCFSFYGNKTLTTGEGGMLVTDDEALATRARMLRDHGMAPDRRYFHPVVGFNYRLTNLQAAVGLAQLERIDAIFARKEHIAALYAAHLEDVPGIRLPPRAAWATPVCWLFSILLEDAFGLQRDDVVAKLEAAGVGCRPLFHPLHEQPPYRSAAAFPVSASLSRRGLSLPSAVDLPDRVVEYVSQRLRNLAQTAR